MGEFEFQLTAVKPYELDWKSRYPLLAIKVKYRDAFSSRLGLHRAQPAIKSIFDDKCFMEKDYDFLTTDHNDRFRWVKPHETSLYRAEPDAEYTTGKRRRLTHYSVEGKIMEEKEMIFPVRPFSITGVTLEDFDPGKEYPVLAIDIDSYIPGEGQEGGDLPEGLASETMTFFLVGDDNGEFVWVGEDNCRLFR